MDDSRLMNGLCLAYQSKCMCVKCTYCHVHTHTHRCRWYDRRWCRLLCALSFATDSTGLLGAGLILEQVALSTGPAIRCTVCICVLVCVSVCVCHSLLLGDGLVSQALQPLPT